MPAEELDAAVESVLAQNKMTREQFEQELSKNNMSFETYRNEVLKEQLLLLKLKKKIIVTMDVDERALREIYEKEFSGEPELYFTASHIIMQASDSNDAEIKDAVTGKIYRRELPIDYYENANFLKLSGENMDGSVSQLVFLSARGIERVKDVSGKGPDHDRCGTH